ncbi:hypothetical protein AB0L68_36490 [Streptomyces sp. NPDC052164]|uniref:hypothetical protein n=1 Tax=Streptomyces sp. NPDC052164 TaxID=3155529 RepID=UPI00341231DA
MDAGLAAVIAGAAGAGGAALAALGTSFAMLRQARIQGDSAHVLWLRNHQQQAFLEMLLAVREMRVFLAGSGLASSPSDHAGGSVGVRYVEELDARLTAVAMAESRVTLLADLETGSSAMALGSAMSSLSMAEMAARGPEYRPEGTSAPSAETLSALWDATHAASSQFAFNAQQTLQRI